MLLQSAGVKNGGDKWCAGVRPDQSALQAAQRILGGRLQAVRERLPYAALESDKDIEHVHQLRIATRRAGEAIRLFARLLPREAADSMRAALRDVRHAADQARDLDVLAQVLQACPDLADAEVVQRLCQDVSRRRGAAQAPIVAVYERWRADDYDARVTALMAGLGSRRRRKARRSYARYARPALRRLVRKFFDAAEADLTDEQALHRFRIAVKKLRYAMELVAVTFAPSFRKELYSQVSALQELLGTVNDYAVGQAFFRQWSAQASDPEQRTFLAGMMLAQHGAHRDVRQVFFTLWTPRFRRDLRRRFAALGVLR